MGRSGETPAWCVCRRQGPPTTHRDPPGLCPCPWASPTTATSVSHAAELSASPRGSGPRPSGNRGAEGRGGDTGTARTTGGGGPWSRAAFPPGAQPLVPCGTVTGPGSGIFPSPLVSPRPQGVPTGGLCQPPAAQETPQPRALSRRSRGTSRKEEERSGLLPEGPHTIPAKALQPISLISYRRETAARKRTALFFRCHRISYDFMAEILD